MKQHLSDLKTCVAFVQMWPQKVNHMVLNYSRTVIKDVFQNCKYLVIFDTYISVSDKFPESIFKPKNCETI